MTTIEKITGQKATQELMNCVRELVEVWMKDNGIQEWEDIVADGDYEFTIANPDYDFCVKYGATKLVLVPDNCSFVIKIPFIGERDWCGQVHHFDGGGYNDDLEVYDYCGEEAYIYEEAEFFGCARFFVPSMYLFSVEDIPIYIQTKVSARYSGLPSNENTYKYASLKGSDTLDSDVGGRLVEYYTNEEIETFLAFLFDHSINDLEGSRNGEYVESFGRYVFWDYSGYHEQD